MVRRSDHLELSRFAVGTGRGPTAPLDKAAKRRMRSAAREIWEKAAARAGELQVHHRIPLEWAHLMPGDPNRLSNLVGIAPGTHTLVNKAWDSFRESMCGRTPSAAEIMKQALEIDQKHGGKFVFPK
jgi:hypothetical protein